MHNDNYKPYTPDSLDYRLHLKALIDAARIERQGIETIHYYQLRQSLQRKRLRQLGVSA